MTKTKKRTKSNGNTSKSTKKRKRKRPPASAASTPSGSIFARRFGFKTNHITGTTKRNQHSSTRNDSETAKLMEQTHSTTARTHSKLSLKSHKNKKFPTRPPMRSTNSNTLTTTPQPINIPNSQSETNQSESDHEMSDATAAPPSKTRAPAPPSRAPAPNSSSNTPSRSLRRRQRKKYTHQLHQAKHNSLTPLHINPHQTVSIHSHGSAPAKQQTFDTHTNTNNTSITELPNTIHSSLPLPNNPIKLNPVGTIYWQTDRYDAKRSSEIYSRHHHLNVALLFGDNDIDKHRPINHPREHNGGQARILGKYDRSIAFGITTTFYGSSLPSETAYDHLLRTEFSVLHHVLLNGGDVVIPAPNKQDLLRSPLKYHLNGTQVIHHNLGTGIANLPMSHLMLIETHINLLRIASSRPQELPYICAYTAQRMNHDPKHTITDTGTHFSGDTIRNKRIPIHPYTTICRINKQNAAFECLPLWPTSIRTVVCILSRGIIASVPPEHVIYPPPHTPHGAKLQSASHQDQNPQNKSNQRTPTIDTNNCARCERSVGIHECGIYGMYCTPCKIVFDKLENGRQKTGGLIAANKRARSPVYSPPQSKPALTDCDGDKHMASPKPPHKSPPDATSGSQSPPAKRRKVTNAGRIHKQPPNATHPIETQTALTPTSSSNTDENDIRMDHANEKSTIDQPRIIVKSKKRTDKQKQLCREAFRSVWDTIPEHSIIIGTDGARANNPTRTGGGVVIIVGKSSATATHACVAIGLSNANNAAETYAIGLGLSLVVEMPSIQKEIDDLGATSCIPIYIFSDSQWSVDALTGATKPTTHRALLQWVTTAMNTISVTHPLHTHWVGGHTDIPLNNTADFLANIGTEGAKLNHRINLYQPPTFPDPAIQIRHNQPPFKPTSRADFYDHIQQRPLNTQTYAQIHASNANGMPQTIDILPTELPDETPLPEPCDHKARCSLCNNDFTFSHSNVPDDIRFFTFPAMHQYIDRFVCGQCRDQHTHHYKKLRGAKRRNTARRYCTTLLCTDEYCEYTRVFTGPNAFKNWCDHFAKYHPTPEFLQVTDQVLCSFYHCNKAIPPNQYYCGNHAKDVELYGLEEPHGNNATPSDNDDDDIKLHDASQYIIIDGNNEEFDVRRTCTHWDTNDNYNTDDQKDHAARHIVSWIRQIKRANTNITQALHGGVKSRLYAATFHYQSHRDNPNKRRKELAERKALYEQHKWGALVDRINDEQDRINAKRYRRTLRRLQAAANASDTASQSSDDCEMEEKMMIDHQTSSRDTSPPTSPNAFDPDQIRDSITANALAHDNFREQTPDPRANTPLSDTGSITDYESIHDPDTGQIHQLPTPSPSPNNSTSPIPATSYDIRAKYPPLTLNPISNTNNTQTNHASTINSHDSTDPSTQTSHHSQLTHIHRVISNTTPVTTQTTVNSSNVESIHDYDINRHDYTVGVATHDDDERDEFNAASDPVNRLSYNRIIHDTNGTLNMGALAQNIDDIRYGESDTKDAIKSRAKRCIKWAKKGYWKKADLALNKSTIFDLYQPHNFAKLQRKFPVQTRLTRRSNELKPTKLWRAAKYPK